jgi:copper chaperone CopZ
MLLVLAISVPLYVCTTGSVPIAASLIAAGMPAGSALVFLMAGPATNVATIGAVYRALGGRVLAIYLGTVIVMSLVLGLGFDFLLGDVTQAQGMHEHGVDWLALWSAVLVIALMAYLSVRRVRNRLAERAAARNPQPKDLVLQVEGMTCQHCVGRVRQTLEGFETVEEAIPSLSTGQVRIRGRHLDVSELIAAIERAGYQAKV